MAKKTEIKASAGGRDDPMVKGSLGSTYRPGQSGAKKVAAEIAEGLETKGMGASPDIDPRAPFDPWGHAPGIPDPPPAARPGFRLVKELDKFERIVKMMEYKGRLYIATTKGVYRSSFRGDVLEPLHFEVEDTRPPIKPTEGTGKT